MGLTLRNILAEVPLYIGVAIRLAVSCKPGGTFYRCCSMLASPIASTTIAVNSSATEAVLVDIAIATALALGVHALTSEGFLLLTVALLELLFLV
jgi:hypothetical protein